MADCPDRRPENTLININTVFGVIFAVYSPVITTINILLITSILATKQSLKNTSNFLIICLSLSDSLIGAIVMPMLSIENLWYNHQRICSLKIASEAVQSCFGGTSLDFTILLAADRYFHMNPDFQTSPSRLAKLFKPPKLYILTLVLFLLAISSSTFHIYATTLDTRPYNNLSFATFLLMLITLFMAMYIRGYLRIRRHVEDNPFYGNRREANSNENPEYLNELFKTVFLLLIAMSVSWLPYLVMHVMFAMRYLVNSVPVSSPAMIVFQKIAYVFFYSNSIWNALIIFYRNKKSREWLVNIFHRNEGV